MRFVILSLIGLLLSCSSPPGNSALDVTVSAPQGLEPLLGALEEIMPEVAARAKWPWGGLNPEGDDPAKLDVFTLDTSQACASSGSRACRWAEAARGSCAAVEPTTIVCDIDFLTTIYLVAGHHGANADRDALLSSEEAEGGSVDSRLTRAAELWGAIPPGEARAVANEMLVGALRFVLLHEAGHIALRHLTEQAPTVPDSERDWFSDTTQEARADRFAADAMIDAHYRELVSVVTFLGYLADFTVQAADRAARTNAVTRQTPEARQAFLDAYCDAAAHDRRHAIAMVRAGKLIDLMVARKGAAPSQEITFINAAVAAQCPIDSKKKKNVVPAGVQTLSFKPSGGAPTLLDGGAAPRIARRYRWVPGERQRTVTVRKSSTFVVAGAAPTETTESISTSSMRIMQADGARLTVGMRLLSSGGAPPARAFGITHALSSSGVFRGTDVHSDSTTSEEAITLGETLELGLYVIPFPDEPIGAGATWSTEQTWQIDAFSTPVTTTYTLVEAREKALVIVGQMSSTPTPSANGNETLQLAGQIDAQVNLEDPIVAYSRVVTLDIAGKRHGVPFSNASSVSVVVEPAR